MHSDISDYHLKVVNNSSDYNDFCVYQTDPGLGIPDIQTLAWFAQPLFPTAVANFTWASDYCFVWGENGQLEPGVIFEASQVWSADPQDPHQDQVLFTYQLGTYTFEAGSAVSSPQLGTLYVKEDASIPLGLASIGIGMSGSGTFARTAQPNQLLSFTPHPRYWVTSGTYEQGEVLDVGAISGAAEIAFPPGVTHMTAVLNQDNSWTVQATNNVNFPQLKAERIRRRRELIGSSR
jgi:hypothetical protein